MRISMVSRAGGRARGSLALAVAALAAAGCASAPEDVAIDAAQLAAAAPAEPRIDPASEQYFQVTVGDRVFFPTDTNTLTDNARGVLTRQAQWLGLNPGRTVLIEGHADERGTREYNIALGARRADAVKTFLVAQGVEAGRISTVSFGRERPVEVCSNEACWARNRRAVTVVR